MKPKCPKCGKAATLATYGSTWKHGTRIECVKIQGGCGWAKQVSRAAIIRLAVAKPETCKWSAVGRMGFLDYYTTGCAMQRGRIEGNFCSGCGKPVEVVNG